MTIDFNAIWAAAKAGDTDAVTELLFGNVKNFFDEMVGYLRGLLGIAA